HQNKVFVCGGYLCRGSATREEATEVSRTHGIFSKEEKLNFHANREGIHGQLAAAHGRTGKADAPVRWLEAFRLESSLGYRASPLSPRGETSWPVRDDAPTHPVAQQSRPPQQLPQGRAGACLAVRFVRTVRQL